MPQQIQLDIERISALMAEKGLSQADIANRLGISRTSVSNWLTRKGAPKARNVGQLALALGVLISDIVLQFQNPPILNVNFRAIRNSAKVSESTYRMARDAGHALNKLSPYLPKIGSYLEPIRLKRFTGSYDEQQELAQHLRALQKVGPTDIFTYHNASCILDGLGIHIVPVLLGRSTKDFPVEALHIRSAASALEWMYFNIEAPRYHFKFMVAHELFHALAKNLNLEKGIEDKFADGFAEALLFPQSLSQSAYELLIEAATQKRRVDICIDFAKSMVIHPYQVYKASNSYAVRFNKPQLPNIQGGYKQFEYFISKNKSLLEEIFPGRSFDEITPETYSTALSEAFCTPIFNALREYCQNHSDGIRIVSTVLFMHTADAAGLVKHWVSLNAANQTHH